MKLMNVRYSGLMLLLCLFLFPQKYAAAQKVSADRKLWLVYLDKVARPVMMNIAQNKLKADMPVLLSDRIDNKESRSKVAYLEAFGRTLSGIAPWLQLEGGDADEVKLRNQYRQWALKGIGNAVNPEARDYMQWNGGQPLVDASFVAFALIRSPWLWEHLDSPVQKQFAAALKMTRNTIPVYSNWILFTGMIEAFLCKYDLGYDPVRIEYAVREFTQHWYIGDGLYSDGMNFQLDYYNSIVIHPYLGSIPEEVNAKKKTYLRQQEKQTIIRQRYAQTLERLIAADGSYPATGRSITYRGGVFHHLANSVYKKQLPKSLEPAQVRGALTAVIKKTLGAPQTFTNNGWLNIGLYGKQPGLAEFYTLPEVCISPQIYFCHLDYLPRMNSGQHRMRPGPL